MKIRHTTKADRDAVRAVYHAAFPESECDTVAKLALGLLETETSSGGFSLVADADGQVIGHVAFSPVTTDGDPALSASILAPLSVHPSRQKQGVGSQLVKHGIRHLTDSGVDAVLVYGDPGYYGRFGFGEELAKRYTPPYPLQHPFGWQAAALTDRGNLAETIKIACLQPLCDPSLW